MSGIELEIELCVFLLCVFLLSITIQSGQQ